MQEELYQLLDLQLQVEHGNVAELFPCSSCDEVKAKKPNACSGDHVIMLADGTLKQASALVS